MAGQFDTRIILPRDLHGKVKAASEREFRTISMQITYIISEWAKYENVVTEPDTVPQDQTPCPPARHSDGEG